jgi:hypothetical protein
MLPVMEDNDIDLKLAENEFTRLSLMYEKEKERKFSYNDPMLFKLTAPFNYNLISYSTAATVISLLL